MNKKNYVPLQGDSGQGADNKRLKRLCGFTPYWYPGFFDNMKLKMLIGSDYKIKVLSCVSCVGS